MFNFNIFCKYFDLRYGAIIISFFYFVGEIASIIGLVVFYVNSGNYAYTNFSKVPLRVVNNPCILILPVLCCIVAIVITALMVYGSIKNKHKLIIPFLLLNSVAIVFGFLISWAYIIFTFIQEGAKGLLWLIVFNGLIAISIYFWIIVYYRLEEIIIENELYEQQGLKAFNPRDPEQNLESWAVKKKPTRIEVDTD